METIALTQEQEQQLRQLKAHFPFRIVWGTITADGQFETYATHDKRKLNAASRKGQPVWTLQ